MKQLFQKILKILRNIFLVLFALSIVTVIVYRFVPVPVTPLMIIRSVEQVFDGKKITMHKKWIPIEKISPELIRAVVAGEDNKFLEHFGFDLGAIRKAVKHNEKSDNTRGASTISQQTAKNVFLWPKRSWIRKGLEAYFTLIIEIFWSKERIMEVYLNVIEMSDGIYGAEVCSQTYFKKPAAKLTKSESALITAILPGPLIYNIQRPSSYIRHRQQLILRLMNKVGYVKFN